MARRYAARGGPAGGAGSQLRAQSRPRPSYRARVAHVAEQAERVRVVLGDETVISRRAFGGLAV